MHVASNDDIIKFLRVIALCHTVHLVPIRKQPHLVGAGISQKAITTEMHATSSLEDMNTDINRKGSLKDYLGDFEYEANSQDEKALLETCCK